MTIESDPNPFPKIELFPRAVAAAHFLLDHLQHEGLSDHARHEVLPASEQGEFDFEAQAEVGW